MKKETDCSVSVTGVSPTHTAMGATVAFAANGTISLRRDYVVLGVDGRSLGLAKDWIYDCAIVQMCNCANEEMGIC